MDWSLRACGRRGHATYAPDEPEFRGRLQAETPIGTAWRCLRCGDFVVGEPRGHGPAADAPEVIRGRALRDLVILRLLAVERLVRGLLVLLVAYGVFHFRNQRGSIQDAFNDDLPLIQQLASKFHWNFEDSAVVRAIHSFLNFNQSTLAYIALGLAIYGTLQLVEAVGLWLIKRWGEYFAVVATAAFIPIEVYELVEKITWPRMLALAINVAAVIYLLVTKRLFGLRGGKAAYEAERHEANLLEVQEAATAERPGHHDHHNGGRRAGRHRDGGAASTPETESGKSGRSAADTAEPQVGGHDDGAGDDGSGDRPADDARPAREARSPSRS